MTCAKYRGLLAHANNVDADERIRVFILCGAGDRAFVAGTDISQFQEFSGIDDALAYERGVSHDIGRLETVRQATNRDTQAHARAGPDANLTLPRSWPRSRRGHRFERDASAQDVEVTTPSTDDL